MSRRPPNITVMNDMTGELTLTTAQVASFARIPEPTLHTWVRTGRVTPSVAAPRGRRFPLLWSLRDAIGVRTIARLRRAGVSGQQLRAVADYLRDVADVDLQSATLVLVDGELYHVDQAGTPTATLRATGQVAMVGSGMTGGDLLARITAGGDVDDDGDGVLTLPVGRWHDVAERLAATG